MASRSATVDFPAAIAPVITMTLPRAEITEGSLWS